TPSDSRGTRDRLGAFAHRVCSSFVSSSSAVRQEGGDVLVFVRAKPRARVSRIVGELVGESGSEIEIALGAPPVDGAANEELVRFLAKALGIARGNVTVERGSASRHKVVRLTGMSVESAMAVFGGKNR